MDRGIHQTGNPADSPLIMVSVYGSPIRHLYVNGFDRAENRVLPIYTNRMKKWMLAGRIVGIL